MCCRYYLKENDPELAPVMDAAMKSPLMPRFQKAHPAPLVRSGEVFPTNLVAVVASNRQLRPSVFPMVWGYTVQGRSTPIVNARVETAYKKTAFQEAWKKHRCAIPASWYFEWQHLPTENGRDTVKTKYAIQPADASITWLCGLYRIENGLPVFVILTREPGHSVVEIHDRMPLIIPKRAVQTWVNPNIKAENVLQYALTDMVAEKAI
ncbi:MAG: SOS response-associated peptidase family protein [Acidaminococcaceae bacterium]|nr:SOS response-associated peptidase family protein [Acidaminococcaceae bacterium]